MKKRTYIKLFNKEANEKIWNFLFSKYQTVEKKSKLLAYCCLPIICIAFGFMAILGWASSLVLFFMDTQFTPHYLRAAILHEKMTNEQATEYLRSREYQYRKSVSFGNMSNKKRKSIETTFELLFDEYKLPIIDENHKEIISNISNLQISIDKTQSDVQYISEYTHVVEQKDIERENKRNEQIQNNKKSFIRENKKNPLSFESSLFDKQIELLVDCCNKLSIFKRPILPRELQDIFLCIHKEPLQTTNTRLLSLLLSKLENENYIHAEWQNISEKYICFISKNGKNLLAKDLSTAYSSSVTVKGEKEQTISDCISSIKSLK